MCCHFSLSSYVISCCTWIGPQGVRWAWFLSVISCHTCKNSLFFFSKKKWQKWGKYSVWFFKLTLLRIKKLSPVTQLSNITDFRDCWGGKRLGYFSKYFLSKFIIKRFIPLVNTHQEIFKPCKKIGHKQTETPPPNRKQWNMIKENINTGK